MSSWRSKISNYHKLWRKIFSLNNRYHLNSINSKTLTFCGYPVNALIIRNHFFSNCVGNVAHSKPFAFVDNLLIDYFAFNWSSFHLWLRYLRINYKNNIIRMYTIFFGCNLGDYFLTTTECNLRISLIFLIFFIEFL